jgi:hypothetical protein
MSIPKKLLIIKDLTFILPDDFNGTLTDALSDYINYINKNIHNNNVVDIDNALCCTEVVLSANTDIRSCIQYGIVEIDNGEYRIIESSGTDKIFNK